MIIYHMCKAEEWQAAEAAGVYGGSSQDIADGFIHFSTAEHIVASAAKHRAGQDGLILLSVDPDPLGDAVKWEEARGGILFPPVRPHQNRPFGFGRGRHTHLPRPWLKPRNVFEFVEKEWCRRVESNRRPLPYQGSALPLSYCGPRSCATCHKDHGGAIRLMYRKFG